MKQVYIKRKHWRLASFAVAILSLSIFTAAIYRGIEAQRELHSCRWGSE